MVGQGIPVWYVEYVLRRLSTNTGQEWMTPPKAIPTGGETACLGWLRTWGSKPYIVRPKANQRGKKAALTVTMTEVCIFVTTTLKTTTNKSKMRMSVANAAYTG